MPLWFSRFPGSLGQPTSLCLLAEVIQIILREHVLSSVRLRLCGAPLMTLGKTQPPSDHWRLAKTFVDLHARWQVFMGERILDMLIQVRVKTLHGTERVVHVDGTVEGPSLKSVSELAFGFPLFAWTNRLSSERQGGIVLWTASHRTRSYPQLPRSSTTRYLRLHDFLLCQLLHNRAVCIVYVVLVGDAVALRIFIITSFPGLPSIGQDITLDKTDVIPACSRSQQLVTQWLSRFFLFRFW